jgi:hypothetical protein
MKNEIDRPPTPYRVEHQLIDATVGWLTIHIAILRRDVPIPTIESLSEIFTPTDVLHLPVDHKCVDATQPVRNVNPKSAERAISLSMQLTCRPFQVALLRAKLDDRARRIAIWIDCLNEGEP